jgi:hypothetical protein
VLLIALIASLFLPAPWKGIALLAQVAFYGAALLDRVLPDTAALKRLTAPVAAFVTLVLAAFSAQAIFFRDPAALWKTTQVRDIPAARTRG